MMDRGTNKIKKIKYKKPLIKFLRKGYGEGAFYKKHPPRKGLPFLQKTARRCTHMRNSATNKINYKKTFIKVFWLAFFTKKVS